MMEHRFSLHYADGGITLDRFLRYLSSWKTCPDQFYLIKSKPVPSCEILQHDPPQSSAVDANLYRHSCLALLLKAATVVSERV